MKSIDKLKRLIGESIDIPNESTEKSKNIADLRRRIDAVISRGRERDRIAARQKAKIADNLKEYVPGEEIENDFGKFFLISDIVRGSCRHGHRNIRDAFDFDMTAAAMLANDPGINKFICSDALFLDTETTGLAGGTGTMAFLIGLGWFAEGHFHVRQILARDFSEEKAALAYLSGVAGQKKFLITFNGKAFDINLLATRFIMNRLASGLSLLPHLDLLHPSRRILGHRLLNSRLVTLEMEILGVEREGDIPGWEIPQRYFNWLKRRDPRLLLDIFQHNRLDVISMATLTAHLVEILTAQSMEVHACADDYLAAAHLLIHRHDLEGVEKILKMFDEESCSKFSFMSRKKLAKLYKRTGRLNDAMQIWREMAASRPGDFYAVSELAKWLEHRSGNCAEAKILVEKALVEHDMFSDEEKASLLHRLNRLNGKVKID
ncbi:MAG: ribonuclease H-like domain-containing protein [Smithella sp.]